MMKSSLEIDAKKGRLELWLEIIAHRTIEI